MVFSFLTWTVPFWGQAGYSLLALGFALSTLRAFTLFSSTYAILTRTGLPTLVAARAWQAMENGVRLRSWPVLFLPAISTLTFVSLVTSWADASYALYWVAVPAAIALTPARLRKSVLVRAMVCSMNAHMIGSLIVLFSGMPIVWAALVPKVLFERLVTAAGIAACAYVWKKVSSYSPARRIA